jgi:hypothetical protein
LKQFTLQFLNSCNIIFQQASSLQHLIDHTLVCHFNSKRFQSMWQVKDAKLWREQWNGLSRNQGNPYNTRKLTGSHLTYLAINISIKFFKGLASTKLLKFQLQLIALNLNSMHRT